MLAISKLKGDLYKNIMPKGPRNLVSTTNLEQTTSERIRKKLFRQAKEGKLFAFNNVKEERKKNSDTRIGNL